MGHLKQKNWNLKYKRLAAVALLVLAFATVGGETDASTASVATQSMLSATNLASPSAGAAAAIATCKEKAECLTADLTPCIAMLQLCIQEASAANATLQTDSQWLEFAKRVADLAAKEAKQEALAMAFKTSLSTFARQVAHDTAVWVASGGRGQKPLFITEGWGAYLKNAADSALGDFISKVGTVYGVDLCKPDLSVKIAITASLDDRRTRAPRCTLSQMSGNWQNAIANPNFVLDYRTSMSAGENDISYMMMLADQKELAISGSINAKTKEAETNDLWTDIKNVAGNILTPGTFIKNKFFASQDDSNASIGYSTFTGTVADVIEEFLNTLVAQLLKQLQSGFFSGSGGGTGSNNQSLGNIDLSSLFNSDSSPALGEGADSAKLLYAKLIEGQTKNGNKFDILLKLSQCSEQAKANPGPTDCVIDSVLQSAIKNKQYVIDLPNSVKSRIFAPKINQTESLDNVITARSIMIMRKYSIVPVGWEFAAQIVAKMDKDLTLEQVMDCYYQESAPAYCINGTDSLVGLVDPYWVLKAPEEFCRKIGYTGYNSLKADQTGAISRNQDCVDEQQCLKEDAKGVCESYGYCTEQRRTWDLGATCQTRNNTCSSFKSRVGDTGNWLTNTLDFASCSSQNAGCRSYATDYNYPSLDWNGEFVTTTALGAVSIKKYRISDGELLQIGNTSDWQVPVGHNVSSNGRLKVSQTCSSDLCIGGYDVSGCSWDNASKSCSFYRTGTASSACTVPNGGFSCIVNNCFNISSGSNLLSGMNGDFSQFVSPDQANATYWTDQLSELNTSDRHYRVSQSGPGGTAYALKLSAASNEARLITTLPDITVDPVGKYYLLKFYAKGQINLGSVRVAVYNGNNSLYGDTYPAVIGDSSSFTGNLGGWKEYSLYFNSAGVEKATIGIITETGSITNELYVADFRLYPMSDKCQKTSIKLFTDEIPSDRVNSNIYFNRNVATCSSADEGCSQFIRIKQGLGSNLLTNGGFEYADGNNQAPKEWNGSGVVVNNPIKSGVYSLALTNGVVNFSSGKISASLENGRKYALSGYVYSGDVTTALTADIVDSGTNLVATSSLTSIEILAGEVNTWKRFQVVFDMGKDVTTYTLRLRNSNSAVAFFDDIKFEQLTYKDTDASSYTAYEPNLRSSSQVSYLKKAQDSFDCYLSGGSWPQTVAQVNDVLAKRSSACSAYAPVCAKEEVGCELYTPTNGDPAVPGVATDLDLCPSECNGYRIYKQEATNFVTSTFQQFIADKNAKYCSASFAGCDEFTNLDAVGQGAERREYYTRIKACQKPSVDDASYYTWEGSDTVGYQLKAYNLKRSNVTDAANSNNGTAPCTNLTYNKLGSEGQPACQDDIAISGLCTKDEMLSNDDCREFYDTTGNIHYRLSSMTVTVSDNCHPYRRTQTQVATANAIKADCDNSHGYWNANNECIYMAIPNEGGVCSAATKGCREYTGNTGNNVRKVINALNFSQTLNNILWTDASGKKDGLLISSESTFVGGSSLSNKPGGNNQLRYPVVIQKNKAYSLSFWAKGSGSTDFKIDSIAFSGGLATDQFTKSTLDNMTNAQAVITTEWRKYDLGPVFITYDPAESTEFVITLPTGKQIYLDNLVLKELNDTVFAVENSWYTPQSCDNKLNDANGSKALATNDCLNSAAGRCYPGEMLGCSSYKDRAGTQWYLKSFTSLCRREAAGCEALIDTANSNSPFEAIFNAGVDDDIAKTVVPKDKLIYMVNDSKYACSSASKGCRAVGLPTVDKWEQILDYQSLFLISDPERYLTDLCKHSELWCEEYNKDNSGLVYFKNPGGKLCDYDTTDKKWYKTGTREACTETRNMTFGTGYDPAILKIQPQGPYENALSSTTKSSAYKGFVGTCPAAETSCNEFVDPYSGIYSNLLPNKYIGQSSATTSVKANVLYQLTGLSIDNPSPLPNDYCGVGTSVTGGNLYYLYVNGSSATCKVRLKPATAALIAATDKISYAGVYYAKSTTVDNSSCSGLVNYNEGCILMNARENMDFSTSTAFNRYLKSLVFDSVATYADNLLDGKVKSVSVSPVVATPPGDSNVIMKASPNRTCAKWLSCTTYQKTGDSTQSNRFDNSDQCLNIGVCSAKDENGTCIQYEPSDTVEPLSRDTMKKGTSGFAIPNSLPIEQMVQWGESANVPNGNFESVMGATKEPAGWTMTKKSADLNIDGWNSYKYSVEGKKQYIKFDSGYLQISGVYAVESDPIDVEGGTNGNSNEYVLDFWVNTTQLSPETAKATVLITTGKVSDNLMQSDFLQNAENVKIVYMDEITWKTSDELRIPPSSNGWVERSVILNIKKTDSISLRLINLADPLLYGSPSATIDNFDDGPVNTKYPNYFNCYDLTSGSGGLPQRGSPNYLTACNVGGSASDGSTYFDNISLKPVLKIKGDATDEPNMGDLIGRTCRAYPAQDGKSCQYYSNNNFYYGWYGYCLMEDPKNPGQCLQWYPIDQLKGDVVDEYSAGYSDRQPLYYCVGAEKSKTKVQVENSTLGLGSGFTNILSGGNSIPGVSNIIAKVAGGDVKTVQFTLDNPGTTRLLRYPMIQRFTVKALAFGFGTISMGRMGVGILYYAGTMEKSHSCFRLFGFDSPCPTTQENTDDEATLDEGASIIDKIGGIISEIASLALGSLSIDTTKLFGDTSISQNSVWGGWGDVLIAALGGFGVGFPISSWDLVEKKLLDSGANISSALNTVGIGSPDFAFDGSVMGAKIVTDNDQKYAGNLQDPNSSIPGDILGIAWGFQPGPYGGGGAVIYVDGALDTYYCKRIVEVVTSMGQNKAWTNRISQGSQFSFLKSDRPLSGSPVQQCNGVNTPFFESPYCLDYTDSAKPNGLYDDIDPTMLGYQFDGYGADYKPYGAIVSPAADSQNPSLWDTYIDTNGLDLTRQPLYWEPPLKSLSEPYQPRMGQPVKADSLKYLFAQPYRSWTWKAEPKAGETADHQGYYERDAIAATTALWNMPTADCDGLYYGVTGKYVTNGYVRDVNDRIPDNYCRVVPKIITSSINGKSSGSVTLDSATPAKLDFTVRVDKDQLPLTSYSVNWGDGDITSISGVKLRARSTSTNPFTLYHLYNYPDVYQWAVKNGCLNITAGICANSHCDTAVTQSCYVHPMISATDNWRTQGTAYTLTTIIVKPD